MQWYFSPSTMGFYNDVDHVPPARNVIPDDGVKITDATRLALLLGQTQGQEIVAGQDGSPALVQR